MSFKIAGLKESSSHGFDYGDMDTGQYNELHRQSKGSLAAGDNIRRMKLYNAGKKQKIIQ
jgi:hypothetical protein